MQDQCCRIFQALSDKSRLKILKIIKNRECCVTKIAGQFDMTQPSISHHLDILKQAQLVTSEKRGREVFYRFNRDAIIECCGIQFKTLDLSLEES